MKSFELVQNVLASLDIPLTDKIKGAAIVYYSVWTCVSSEWKRQYARDISTQLQDRISAASRQSNSVEAFTSRISKTIAFEPKASYIEDWQAATALASVYEILEELRSHTSYINCINQFVIQEFYKQRKDQA